MSTAPLRQALDLLLKARVCHRVVVTSANGLPLGAEVDEKFSKVILLDCGLCSALLGLSISQLRSITEISIINNRGSGAIAAYAHTCIQSTFSLLLVSRKKRS